MDRPLISVMIGAFNAAPYLAEAIDSALSQSYRPLELIVVDDGSDDGTADVAQSYGDSVRFAYQDNAGNGHTALAAARNQLLGLVAESKLLANVRPNGQEDTPQFKLDVDTAKAAALGVEVSDINATLSAAWGGSYIDDFIDRGRVKRVYVQADAPFRMSPEDFRRWSVRNSEGRMVPVSSFASWHWGYGSPRLERYNGVSAMEIQGEAAEGVSTGQAMAEIERLVEQLPPGFGIEWSGASYQEREAGTHTPLLYALSFAIVFLCLAALYESWTIPTAVLMVAPLGILGATLASTLSGLSLAGRPL